MGHYIFKRVQTLNSDIETIWSFVSKPENLEKITPDNMHFSILSKSNLEMEEGMLIAYKISPFLDIKTTWITMITNVKKNEKFIDQQVMGPYKFWHHEHKFQVISSNKVKMTDIITYIPPFGFLGDIANELFLKKKLNNIFDYRNIILNNMFNTKVNV
jgi:ligand-binding SRPBCC domain-containing protein|tara:strand:+ start:1179 stop:1652 length:474 start_codon:yes stop_codon:yes gene_type:complete